jgi:UPF0716 protein FxsA
MSVSWLARLVLFFTIFPLVELSLLLLIGQKTSVATTVGFVLITGLLGAIMLRWQGLQALRKVQQDLQSGQMPTDSLVDGLLIVIASLLLISPGVITDLVGITLLVPWFRRGYRWLAVWYFTKRYAGRFRQSGGVTDQSRENRRTEVIDSYVVENQPPGEK